MNYRHHFHAGNFADVLKHGILIQLLQYFYKKNRSLFVLDTHAGAGRYDLTAEQAQRNPEYLHGITKLYNEKQLSPFYSDYVNCIKKFNPSDKLIFYPGSPLIIKEFLNKESRYIACELHPQDHARLSALLRKHENIKIFERDGYEMMLSVLPFTQEEGLILIDPPFEQKNEFATLFKAVQNAYKKCPNGIYMIWYPIKSDEALLFEEKIHKTFEITEFFYADNPDPLSALTRTGVALINSPFQIKIQ